MLISIPRPQTVAGTLLSAALAVSTGAQTLPAAAVTAGNGCILPVVVLAEDGSDTLLEISIEGAPRALGARLGEVDGVVLDLAGCVPAPGLSDLAFVDGLVAAVQLAQRIEDGATLTSVAVETRQPVEYTVTSSEGSVRVRLQPRFAEATPGAGPRQGALPEEPHAPVADAEPAPAAPSRLVRVLEPLPLPDARPPEPAEEDRSRITGLTESWARAWSEQRVDDYLSFYAAAFRPAEGSRPEWETRRRQRVAAPSFVEVGLDGIEVRIEDGGRVTASFWQSYASDLFSDLVYKRLTWAFENGAWKIVEEGVVTPPPAAVPELPMPEG